MGQTLENGIFLPDEGERNCYSGLAENWVALDTLVGAYSSHYQNTTIHVTASDKQTWNGKQDALSQTQLDAVNSGIDATAHKRGYDTGVSLMSYATSNNARYHADAVEFSDWRDSVWDMAHDVENKVLADELDIDDVSVVYVLERLPVLEW